MKITKCKGNGQCQCSRCEQNGKWNILWTDMAYKIDGLDGVYCSECVKEILEMRNKND